MKKFLTIPLVAIFALGLNSMVIGADDDAAKKKKDPNAERNIKGEAQCAKCSLKVAEECASVIVTKRKNKEGEEQEVVYWLVGDDQHKELFCMGKTEVMAKGTVKREGKGKDAKMVLTASSVTKAGGKGKGKAKGKAKGKGKGKDDAAN